MIFEVLTGKFTLQFSSHYFCQTYRCINSLLLGLTDIANYVLDINGGRWIRVQIPLDFQEKVQNKNLKLIEILIESCKREALLMCSRGVAVEFK